MKHHHIVILCGGEGKRLSPLATPEHPKQFLQWTQTTTLFDETVKRIQPFLDAGVQLHVVTQKKYRHFFSAYEQQIKTFFEEDESRNTAPAMLYALQGILEQDQDARVTFVPADHFIATPDLFMQTFDFFLKTIDSYDVLCTMGIKPTRAATEYGYIEFEFSNDQVHRVKQFYEKPTLLRAQAFVEHQHMLWNTGVYGGTGTVFIRAFEQYAQYLIQEIDLYRKNKILYSEVTQISFDFAIAEKSTEMIVLDAKYEWSDVGSLDVFFDLCPLAFSYKKQHASLFHFEQKNMRLL